MVRHSGRLSIEEEWIYNNVCCTLTPLRELTVNINMPAATDSAQSNWIVILRVSSANRSKQSNINNLNKQNHYAALVSNPAGDGGTIDVCLLGILCVVRYKSLWWADHSSRGVLPNVVCLSVIEEPHRAGLGPLGLLSHKKRSFNTLSTSSPLVVNESQVPYVSRQKCGILCAIDQLTFMKNKT
jgi:hypothetical protein